MSSNPVVLVTGASAGIGEVAAKSFLDHGGYTVYVAARRMEKMEGLKALGAIPIKMDITKAEEVESAVETIQAAHGGVDILVNNAGFGLYGAVEVVPIEEARYQFEVNLFGLANLTQLLLPGMREKGAGRIINVSSIAGRIFTKLGGWYIASKHALEGWSDCLRLELKGTGIEVVVIQPGIIRTEFGEVARGDLVDRMAGTPYEGFARKFTENFAKTAETGSPPQVIADLILEAATTSRPKTRYHAGKFAGLMLFLRRWLSDRGFEKVLERAT